MGAMDDVPGRWALFLSLGFKQRSDIRLVPSGCHFGRTVGVKLWKATREADRYLEKNLSPQNPAVPPDVDSSCQVQRALSASHTCRTAFPLPTILLLLARLLPGPPTAHKTQPCPPPVLDHVPEFARSSQRCPKGWSVPKLP